MTTNDSFIQRLLHKPLETVADYYARHPGSLIADTINSADWERDSRRKMSITVVCSAFFQELLARQSMDEHAVSGDDCSSLTALVWL
jgi:hypothetical protein